MWVRLLAASPTLRHEPTVTLKRGQVMLRRLIDLHCHVLPEIDDGPATVADAVALARAAVDAGTHAIVATPHVSWEHPNRAAAIAASVGGLTDRLAAEGVELSLHAGAEVAASRVFDIDHEELASMTLGGGSWLLLEPPIMPVATGFDEIAFSLIRRGYRVVVAHPERCPAFHRDRTVLASLAGAGALMSITASSFTGRFGDRVRRFAMSLAAEELVHNVVSDAHDATRRPPGMAAEIEAAGLGGLREWLTDLVPAAILAGDPIPPRPWFSQPKPKGFLARFRHT